jgi:hypothetical protein
MLRLELPPRRGDALCEIELRERSS